MTEAIQVYVRQKHINRIEELIRKGAYTQVQILRIILEEFPKVSIDTITKLLEDSKSKKHKIFSQVAKEDEFNRMYFKDSKSGPIVPDPGYICL